MRYQVTTVNSPLLVRNNPSPTAGVVANLPSGSIIEVPADSVVRNGFRLIKRQGNWSHWAAEKFLKPYHGPMSAALDDLMLRSIGAADDQQANERFDMLIRSSSYVSFRQLMSSRVHGVMDMNRRPVTRGFDYRSDFRISGYLVVRPHSINPANRQLRQRAIDLIRTTTLAVGLWDLMQQTRQRGLEYGANILGDGTLEQWPGPSSPLTVSASRPSANTIGQVHTHPSGPTLQPPSVVDFIRNDGYVPVQLVVESCSGRLWALFWPRYTALLGRLTQTGFQMLNPVDSRAELMFEILGAWEWRQAQEAEQEQERRQRAREFHQGRR